LGDVAGGDDQPINELGVDERMLQIHRDQPLGIELPGRFEATQHRI
jgi:hypothetical protein